MNFVGPDEEFFEVGDAEAGGEGDVGGVAAVGHEDAADAGFVVAGVEGPPAIPEIDFEPGAEIHGAGNGGNADVAEVTGDVAGGDVHAAAEGDGQMREIAADPEALAIAFGSGARVAGELVTELDVVVDEITNRLHPAPAERGVAEELPGGVLENIHFAVTAGQQEGEAFDGEFLDRVLNGIVSDWIG